MEAMALGSCPRTGLGVWRGYDLVARDFVTIMAAGVYMQRGSLSPLLLS